MFRIYCRIVLVIALCTASVSCDRPDPTPAPAPVQASPCLITRYQEAGSSGYFLAFEYDGQKRMTKLTSDDEYLTIEYNGAGRAVKALTYDNNVLESTTVLEYNARGQWIKSTITESVGGDKTELTAEYDGSGNRTKLTYNDFDGSTLDYGSTETFTYANGNLTRSEVSWSSQGSDPSVTTYTYEYYTDRENKMGYADELFVMLGGDGLFFPQSRNMIKKKTGSGNNFSGTTDYMYEYNDKGFPTKITLVDRYDNTTETDVYNLTHQCD